MSRGENSKYQLLPGGASTAGWIFADMLLVIMIIALGAQVTKAADPDEGKVPKEPKGPVVMQEKAIKHNVSFDADALLGGGAAAKREATKVRQQIRAKTQNLKGKKAAMVMVWGRAPEVGRGTSIANTVAKQLKPSNPRVFSDVVPRPLWTGGSEGVAELEIYVLSRESAKSQK